MPSGLTEALHHRFRTDGIAFPIPVLSTVQAQSYRDASDELEARLGGRPRTIEVRQMHLHLPWAYQLATHPRILDAVEDLLGPDLLIWATELFAKHPHDATVSIRWHRDRPYMGFTSGRTVTAWIALAESTPANGCMRAVPRSAESLEPAGKRLDQPADERDVLDVVLRAGEMSLHDPDVLHGSGPNQSALKRVGFAVRYMTTDTRPATGRPAVLLARGDDRYGHFEVVDPPANEDPASALAALRDSANRHLDAVLQNLKYARR